MDVCFYIKTLFYKNEKILAKVKLFVFWFVIKLVLNCSCSIDVSYCFAHLLCVFFLLRSVLYVLKSLFAVVSADVTGIGIMDILRR